ncbi:conserved hypothetical protein [Burkholderia pseudomallei 1710b]|uniref:Uncharacterized protein n=1 Tax=Burkholderia pseudomallei (strain 1710b) TaxID=320372 RepID=Q3JUP4_BURP1|nr:conserved hypothetical protein [Burkholderia pseudomallei 1710b]
MRCMRSRARARPRSDIRFDFVALFLEPVAARGGLALAHQHRHPRDRRLEVELAERDGHQAAGVGVHRRVPQLLGAHFAQALEAADRPLRFAHAVLAQLVEDRLELAFVERVELLRRLLAARGRVDPEKRRPRDEHVAALDQLREMLEEQREQQHLNVRAVDIRIRQDADLAVTQVRHVDAVVRAVRIDADRHRDVVHLVVREQAIALGLPGVEHLAAQRQDRLVFLVAAHLRGAARRIALDEEQLVARDVLGLAVGQLAGQHRDAGALLLLDLLARARARLRLLDHELGELLAVLDVLVEPQLERRARERRHELHRVAAVQALLDLPLELRIEHLRREHERHAREHVLREQLHALRLQVVQLDEALHRLIEAVAQAGFMRAARGRRNQVHVRLAHERAFLAPRDDPRRALALGERVVARAGIGEALALEKRNQQLAAVHLVEQVAAQAVVVFPALPLARLLVDEHDLDARQQHRLRAQEPLQLAERQIRRIEVFRIRPYGHPRAGLLLATARALRRERLDDVAVGEAELRDPAVAPDGHVEARRERIRHRHAHAVQTARERVRAALRLVELAAGVQPREHDLDDGHLLLRMQPERNAAPVVLDGHRLIGVQRDRDLLAEAAQRLVGRVVDHFLDDVQRILGARVHAGPLLDGLEALEHLDRCFAIGRCRLFRGHRSSGSSFTLTLSPARVDNIVDKTLNSIKIRVETMACSHCSESGRRAAPDGRAMRRPERGVFYWFRNGGLMKAYVSPRAPPSAPAPRAARRRAPRSARSGACPPADPSRRSSRPRAARQSPSARPRAPRSSRAARRARAAR